MQAVGESMNGEAAELMTAWVRRVSEWMGRSVGACSEWSTALVEAFRMRLEVMKTISS